MAMTTDKEACNIIVDLLVSHGVRHAVVSPGSRNAPLLVALARCESLKKTVVIDERSAAFVALGIASTEQVAVALVCTSGTAVLNYAPAVAEAYYRCLPLIVISADRPQAWIDQDDSQTIRQRDVLHNIVKASYHVDAEIKTDLERRVAVRTVNDAMTAAMTGRKSPVHINVGIAMPLNGMAERKPGAPVVELIEPSSALSLSDIRRLAADISSPRKVMIVGGNHCPSQRLNRALNRLSKYDNIVVMCENLTNLHGEKFIDTIDSALTAVDEDVLSALAPDVVVSFGGAPVSALLKQYLRRSGAEHWSVGTGEWSVDTYLSLTRRINVDPEDFFSQLASTLRHNGTGSDYAARWAKVDFHGRLSHRRFIDAAPWCDLKAFDILFCNMPSTWNVQISNGMSIRYSQLFASRYIHRCDCNRGVSGIDGSTSTAIGASTVYSGTTLLITGDMSAAYDIGALSLQCIPSRFRMIVMCNGGGDIFRYVKSTSQLPEREQYFSCRVNLPLRQLAEAYGFDYYEACDDEQLMREFRTMMAVGDRPAIMAVCTPQSLNAEVMKDYINRRNIIKNI